MALSLQRKLELAGELVEGAAAASTATSLGEAEEASTACAT